MPAGSPWIDLWAPPQWTVGNPESAASVTVNTQQNTGLDTTIHWKVSGTIILALVVIFGLQAMGFRFVVAANTSIGIGR